jgi:hypothetical protein
VASVLPGGRLLTPARTTCRPFMKSGVIGLLAVGLLIWPGR